MDKELKACPCCHQPASPYGWKSAGCMNPDCMLTGMWFEWDIWQRKRAQLPSQGGEAVAVVACTDFDTDAGVVLYANREQHLDDEPLMTVAQHQRILAASVGSAEPVAWAHPAYLKTGALGFEASVCRLSSLQVPLYTHPADQVADDLTMVKVSRELLEIVFRYADDPSRQLSPGVGAPGHCHREPGKWDGDGGDCELCAAYDQLRALLAKP